MPVGTPPNPVPLEDDLAFAMEARLGPPHRTTQALAVAVAGLLLLMLANPPGWWLFPLSLVWIAYWLPIWRYGKFGQVLLFAAAAASLYGFERGIELNQIRVIDGLFCLMMIGFLSLGARYCESLRFAAAYDIDDRHPSGPIDGWALVSALVTPRWMLGGLSIAIAVMTLIVFPETRSSIDQYWLKPAPARLIFLILTMFFGWMVCRVVLGWLARRRMTPEVRQLEFRALYANEFWPELAGVEKRRARPKFRLRGRKVRR